MNIAIDISPLSGGHSGRGVGIYTKQLIESLQKYESEHSYTFITRGQKVINNTDLVHYPYFDPFFLTLPVIKTKETVVTVHDLIPLVFPDKFPAGIRGNLKWQIQKAALKKSGRIITDSQTSKNDIARITGIQVKNIDVVSLAPSQVYQKVTDEKAKDTIRQQYKLHGDFVVYVGDVNWNKNVTGLLQAFGRLRNDSENRSVSLVVIGKAFLNNELTEVRQINDLIKQLHLEDTVIHTGYVPDEDLSVIYSTARCLVQPSHYEGFGLPVLEAMMCGCPVVAADNSSLAEIGGSAVKVNAENDQDIADGIAQLLKTSDDKRKKMTDEGISWAKSFTWRRVARETVKVYEKVVSGA